MDLCGLLFTWVVVPMGAIFSKRSARSWPVAFIFSNIINDIASPLPARRVSILITPGVGS